MTAPSPDEARLRGYCAGTLSPTERPACPVCGAPVGLTAEGLVGHHVARNGDTVLVEGLVESEPECVQAHNSATPGLLVAREYDRISDRWRVVHAPTGLVVHPHHRTYDFATAMRLAEKLGTLCDWFRDEVRDSESVHVSTLVLCHLAALGKLDEVG